MGPKPDFTPDSSGPYLRPRLIPKRPGDGDPPSAKPGQGDNDNDNAEVKAKKSLPEAAPRAAVARTQLWFEDTAVVPDVFRDLLVEYSHIPPGQVDEHIVRVRDRAWQVHPYPCLGQFRFLELNLSHRPGDLYRRLLSVLTSSSSSSSSASNPSTPLFLDVGTCLGQDVRKLIHDGAPADAVVGAELSGTFIELGYELFRDSPETVRMVRADVLAPLGEGPLGEFKGKLKVVQLGMILHLFSWEEQITAFTNAMALLRDEKGVLVIGQATGNLDGLETRTLSPGGKDKGTWKHNVETFKRLVGHVEAATGTKWEVRADLDEGLSVNDGKRTWDDSRTRRLLFEIKRVG